MTKSLFVCQQCGYSQVGWSGRCPSCNSWGSLVETLERKVAKKASLHDTDDETLVFPQSLSKVLSPANDRVPTGIEELDRVLGGGVISGQVILISGEPGIGKSTLLTTVASEFSQKTKKRVLYISGEESASQVKIRSKRLNIKEDLIDVLEQTNVDKVISYLSGLDKDKLPALVIVDSIQTLFTDELTGIPGSVGQVRESAFKLIRFAKKNMIPIFLIGHITKEGTVAGPAVLMHIVDTFLWFEGDLGHSLRLLRAVKNRFGATEEVGIFEMTDQGLKSVSNTKKLFLTKGALKVSGSCLTVLMQGTRPLLVEIQSLVSRSELSFPKRVAQGLDPKRLELMVAVLSRRSSLFLYNRDVFVNVAGGISVKEPASDLALCLSLASSFFDKSLPERTVAIGEVGLLGEIREVPLQERRIKEAKRLGFSNVVSSLNFSFLNPLFKAIFK